MSESTSIRLAFRVLSNIYGRIANVKVFLRMQAIKLAAALIDIA